MNLKRIKDAAGTSVTWIGIVFLFLSLVVGVFLYFKPGVLVQEDVAMNVAAVQNYADPQVTDKHIFFVDWHGCDKRDIVAFDITAKNISQQKVEVVICCSTLFKKGCTLRVPQH